MSAATTASPARADLAQGQLRNLILATIASAVGFWGWTVIGPLSKSYATSLGLSPSQTGVLVAMPIFVGSIARIPVGALTDRFGGRIMFTVILGLTAPLVALTGIVGSAKSFAGLLVVSFFLGIAGTVFAIGIPFCSEWYDSRRKGFATGVFGAGMVGTAVSAFFTPRIVKAIGYLPAHFVIAGVVLAAAVMSFLFLRNSPVHAEKTVEPMVPKILGALRLKVTWQLCFLYGIVFGAFVAFSNYLPTYLGNVYYYEPSAAGTRTAGFAVAAVIARPIGGIIADRIGPKLVTLASFVGVIISAVIIAFAPQSEAAYGTTFLLMAVFLGLGTGGVFGWVGRAAPPKGVGAVSGIIAAAGGLGGYFPPLIMGATYQPESTGYFTGLMLLAAFALVGLLLALTVKHGGKPAPQDGAGQGT